MAPTGSDDQYMNSSKWKISNDLNLTENLFNPTFLSNFNFAIFAFNEHNYIYLKPNTKQKRFRYIGRTVKCPTN